MLPIPDKVEKVLESHTRVDGVVKFKCKEKGYEISGSEMRTCQNNGLWSGVTTSCKSKNVSLLGFKIAFLLIFAHLCRIVYLNKLQIKKGDITITEEILCLIVPISFYQVSHPLFKKKKKP